MYVKITALPNTWFKEGTEVYHCDVEPKRRLTAAEFLEWVNPAVFDSQLAIILVQGTRVCENPNSEGLNKVVGEEYQDGECCSLDEFSFQFVEESC
jgi:hypothetical protein